MFSSKKTARPTEATLHGWRDRELKLISTILGHDRPNLQTSITGFRHGITFDGDSYLSKLRLSRADHQMYQKSALLFDEPPGDENLIPMIEQENELVGTFLFGQVQVRGQFAITSKLDDLGEWEMGWVNISCAESMTSDKKIPLLQFGFTVRDTGEQLVLQEALRTSLATGSAYMNLLTDKVDDVEGWLSKFREDGYSPSLRLRRVFIGAEVGRGSFD